MRRRYFGLILVTLILFLFSLLLLAPGARALAIGTHNALLLATPTAAPDAASTLQTAQQEETNIQTILNIINVLVVVYPLLLVVAGVVLGVFGFRNIRSLEEQGHKVVDEIKSLQKEAEEKKTEIASTQTALVYLALGDRLANQKDTRRAIEAYKKAGNLLQNNPQFDLVLGRIYSDAGYYEEAIGALSEAIAAQTNYPEAEMELGLAYRRRGEYQRGSDAQAQRDKDYEQAIKHLEHAIELQPAYDDALGALGGLYRRKGEYEKALEYYEKAYQASPGSSYALGNVASLAWYLGKATEARRYYILAEATAGVRTMDTHSEIYWDYYDLALAQLVLGKTEEAKKNYKKAIGDTPGTVQFDSVLSVLHFLKQAPQAKEPINGLDEVIKMIEEEKATRISLG